MPRREGESVAAVAQWRRLAAAGCPMQWLLDLVELSSREFQDFGLFVVFAALFLIYTIAASVSAP